MGFPQNERLSEGLACVNGVAYSGTLTTAVLAGPVDFQKCRKAIFLVQGFTLGASATVTAKLQGAVTSGGSYTDIAGSSTTLVKATDDNKFLKIELSADYLNNLGLSYRFVKLSVGADVSSAVATVIIAGTGPNEPVSAYLDGTGNKTAANVVLN